MRYWIYLNGEVPGSYEAGELAGMPGFSQTTLVCPAGGEIQEKNWRRAGEFPELAAAVDRRKADAPPPAPLEEAASGDLGAMLDTTGARLISHVSELMKQLESGREQKELVRGLQDRVAALEDDLKLARQKASAFEEKAARFEALQAQSLRDAGRLAELESSDARARRELADLRAAAESLKSALEAAREENRRGDEERAAQRLLTEKLASELAQKGAALGRAVAVVRGLEQALLPGGPAASTAPVEPFVPLAPAEPEAAAPTELLPSLPSLPALPPLAPAAAALSPVEEPPSPEPRTVTAGDALLRTLKGFLGKDLR